MKRHKLRHQPRLVGEHRHPILACLHPELAAMVAMDADSDGVSIGWIVNDAIARYYDMVELSSTVIFRDRQRHKRQQE